MANIYEIGLSGLQAAQIGLSVTGQNISNANTPGYNLRVAEQAASREQGYGFGFVGQGVQVTTITRQYDQLLGKQINAIQSRVSHISSYSNLIAPINNVIADSTAGLSPSLQSFFSSLQNLSSDPSGMAAMQSSLSSAQTLASQFHSLQTQLDQQSSGINAQISASVANINNYAKQIASLNKAIQAAYATTNNQPSNALLDERDALINSLSQEVQVTVVPEGNQYNVFIGNGQPLVVGATSSTLTTVKSVANPANLEVAYNSNNTVVPIHEKSLAGGALGGLFAFRSNSLSPIQNSLGQIAIVLGSALNAQNRLGQTVDGQMGGDLFTIASPVINANATNLGNAQLSATITDPGALNADNYSLSYDGSNYTITDTTTNTVMSTFASFPATPTPGVNMINGVTYTLSSGVMASGDSFLISPTADGAAEFDLATTDPRQFASAVPIATSAAATNTGTGVMTPGSVVTGFTPGAVAPPTTLIFNSVSVSVSGFPLGSTIVVTKNGVSTTYPNYVPGTAIPYEADMTMTFNNMTVGLSGTPANGDAFTIGPNTNGVGDNRNMLLMSALVSQNTMSNGETSFQGAYAQLVSTIGNTTSQLITTGATQTNLLNAAKQQQQSESGVNLDQETVNLLQYQQAYQASGKVIEVAKQNFDLLLGL